MAEYSCLEVDGDQLFTYFAASNNGSLADTTASTDLFVASSQSLRGSTVCTRSNVIGQPPHTRPRQTSSHFHATRLTVRSYLHGRDHSGKLALRFQPTPHVSLSGAHRQAWSPPQDSHTLTILFSPQQLHHILPPGQPRLHQRLQGGRAERELGRTLGGTLYNRPHASTTVGPTPACSNGCRRRAIPSATLLL